MIIYLLLTIGINIVAAITDPTHLCQELINLDCKISYIQMDPDETVCGTNGVTYNNYCYYGKARCRDMTISLKHTGPCVVSATSRSTAHSLLSTTTTHSVVFGAFCSNKDIIICGQESSPICGSDKRLYRNTCLFKKARCINPTLREENLVFCIDVSPTTTLDPILSAFCVNKDSIVCDQDTTSPICGSDKRLYRNKCFYSKAYCDNPSLRSMNLSYCIDTGALVGK